MTISNRNTRRDKIAAVILLLVGNILFFLTLWLLEKYDKICFDQVLFQMKSSSAGVHHALVGSAVLSVGGLGIIATAVEIIIYLFLSGSITQILKNSKRYISYRSSKTCVFFRKKPLMISLVSLVLCLSFFISQMDIVAYAETASEKSDFIETHYVDPEEIKIEFPKQKRNLIYIFLESMENTFADTAAGGSIVTNYIPELTALANDHISFSNTAGIGGAFSYSGTTWTASAMVAQTSGIPVKVPITADAYGDEDVFMPGVVSIGEILDREGYNQVLLVGSDAEFHGRKPYFIQHGNYTILDINSLKGAERLPEDYCEWWGFEDEKLFAYAKEELTRLAAEGEPFNLTMLTADTHFPDGYRCRLCGNSYETQYANVLSCSSKQVYSFISWIKEQPFYESTTVILAGDHLTMDSEFLEDIDTTYVRTVYNCIINAPIEPVYEKNRQFGSFDMFPTTLAALGVIIPGDRLGLGTDLFADRKTLTEEYGFEALDLELQKKSEFYNAAFLGMN